MGYYIQVPRNHNKAVQIVELYLGKIISRPTLFEEIPANKALICVVDNGAFEAAGFAYDEVEFQRFSAYDGRSRTWLIIDRKEACRLTGFEE